MEKITVIIPVYNIEKYIKNSLNSVTNQSWKNLQIICVDDGSTDNSLKILNKIAESDSRIEVIHKKNEGVSIARNTALEYANGDYILFLDGDDWLETETCEKAMRAIMQYNADLVMWPYIREFGYKSLPKTILDREVCFEETDVQQKLYRRMIGLYGDELHSPENADALCTVWGKLYKTELIKKNNIKFYDIREIGTYEDGLFNLEVLRFVKKAIFIPEYLYHYRRDDISSITNKYNPKLPQQWKRLFHIMAEHIRNHDLSNEYKQALYNRIALSLIVLGINAVNNSTNSLQKVKEIKKILENPLYRSSVKKLDLSYFPIHWKVFFVCAKYNCAIGVYILIQIIQKIRGR